MSDLNKSSRNNEYTRIEATTLENNTLKAVNDELCETQETRDEGLRILRKRLQDLPDIESSLEENFLLKFLRVAKFDPTKSFDRIMRYYKMQDKLMTLLKDISIPVSVIENMRYTFVLPYRTKDNSAVVVAKMGAIDYSRISFVARSFLDILATDYLLQNPITQMCGITTVFDFADFKYKSLLAVNPKTAIDYMYNVQNAIPLRIKGFHVINAPSVFMAFYKLFRIAMSEKLKQRVFLHPNDDNWESLHRCIPPDILPEEYGGLLTGSPMIDLLENIEDLEKNFLQQFRFGYVETKHLRASMKLIVPVE